MNVNDLLSTQLEKYLRDLEYTVNTDSGTHIKAGVDNVGKYVLGRAQDLGAQTEIFPLEQVGDCIYLRWKGTGSGRVFMIGHLDTVYPAGTFVTYPFRYDGRKILGPGAADMKAGVWGGIYAAHALATTNPGGFAEIAMICNTDEEIGSLYSRGCYLDLARGSDAALVLEPARESGAIVSARKGVGTFEIVASGKSAHAGVEPERGASAIDGLAHMIVELRKLNGIREGLTVNTGVIEGGLKSNVVADQAKASVDLRVVEKSDAEYFEEQLRSLCAREFVKGVRIEFTGGITNPPMERTGHVRRLVEWASEAGQEVEIKVTDVATGGGSDGNIIAELGIPVLDGLGPQGGRAHNAAEEYVLIDSIAPRVSLLARLIEIICERHNDLKIN